MSINAALKILLEEYPGAKAQDFKGNAVADFIRNEIPTQVADSLSLGARYIIEGSPGKGNWASVPWIAILDKFITETVQDGYYVVYLIKEDFSGLYLSLNQGVTTVRKQYGATAKDALEIRAKDYLARLGEVEDKYIKGHINLACSPISHLAKLYECGSILSVYYDKKTLPEDNVLSSDLSNIIRIYFLFSPKNQTYSTNPSARMTRQNWVLKTYKKCASTSELSGTKSSQTR